MCRVHLVPEIDTLIVSCDYRECNECGGMIEPGETYRFIKGGLDDGSPERYSYQAHSWCYELSVSDVSPDRCFTYGNVQRS